MTKFRKNVIGAIMCLVMLLVGVCAFTACGSKDLSVTFTVEGKTQTVDVVNGKVTMPADPERNFMNSAVGIQLRPSTRVQNLPKIPK